jgi:hypothetical protein
MGVVPGDPKECRIHAKNCMQLAETATAPELRRTYVDLAHHWNRLAVELEDAKALWGTLNKLEFKDGTET